MGRRLQNARTIIQPDHLAWSAQTSPAGRRDVTHQQSPHHPGNEHTTCRETNGKHHHRHAPRPHTPTPHAHTSPARRTPQNPSPPPPSSSSSARRSPSPTTPSTRRSHRLLRRRPPPATARTFQRPLRLPQRSRHRRTPRPPRGHPERPFSRAVAIGTAIVMASPPSPDSTSSSTAPGEPRRCSVSPPSSPPTAIFPLGYNGLGEVRVLIFFASSPSPAPTTPYLNKAPLPRRRHPDVARSSSTSSPPTTRHRHRPPRGQAHHRRAPRPRRHPARIHPPRRRLPHPPDPLGRRRTYALVAFSWATLPLACSSPKIRTCTGCAQREYLADRLPQPSSPSSPSAQFQTPPCPPRHPPRLARSSSGCTTASTARSTSRHRPGRHHPLTSGMNNTSTAANATARFAPPSSIAPMAVAATNANGTPSPSSPPTSPASPFGHSTTPPDDHLPMFTEYRPASRCTLRYLNNTLAAFATNSTNWRTSPRRRTLPPRGSWHSPGDPRPRRTSSPGQQPPHPTSTPLRPLARQHRPGHLAPRHATMLGHSDPNLANWLWDDATATCRRVDLEYSGLERPRRRTRRPDRRPSGTPPPRLARARLRRPIPRP